MLSAFPFEFCSVVLVCGSEPSSDLCLQHFLFSHSKWGCLKMVTKEYVITLASSSNTLMVCHILMVKSVFMMRKVEVLGQLKSAL